MLFHKKSSWLASAALLLLLAVDQVNGQCNPCANGNVYKTNLLAVVTLGDESFLPPELRNQNLPCSGVKLVTDQISPDSGCGLLQTVLFPNADFQNACCEAPNSCVGPLSFLGVCGTCFSGESTVEVMDGAASKTIPMKDLSVNDSVLTSDGSYSKVYSFGHYEPNANTEYVQIKTNSMKNKPLEISHEHLLYKMNHDGTKEVVAASDIQVGDMLVNSNEPQEVVSIKTITRNGAYSPLTNTGDIVVNGVVASNYVTRAWLKEMPVSYTMLQYFQHGGILPYRLYCNYIGDCSEETYDETTGFNPYLQFLFHIEIAILSSSMKTLWLSMVSILGMMVIGLGKLISTSPFMIGLQLMVAIMGYAMIRTNNKKDMVGIAKPSIKTI